MFSWFPSETTLISQWIMPALYQFLDVEKSSHGIETDYPNKRIDIRNVPLRARSVVGGGNASDDEGHPLLLYLSGEICRLTLTWTSSSSFSLDGLTLTLEGLRLSLQPHSPDSTPPPSAAAAACNNSIIVTTGSTSLKSDYWEQEFWSRVMVRIRNVELSILLWNDKCCVPINAHHCFFSTHSVMTVLSVKQLEIKPISYNLSDEKRRTFTLSIDSLRVFTRTFDDSEGNSIFWIEPSCFYLSLLCSRDDTVEGVWDVFVEREDTEANSPLLIAVDFSAVDDSFGALAGRRMAKLVQELFPCRFSKISFPPIEIDFFANETKIRASSLQYQTGEDSRIESLRADMFVLSIQADSQTVQIAFQNIESTWCDQRVCSLRWKNAHFETNSTNSSCVLRLPGVEYMHDDTMNEPLCIEHPVSLHASSFFAMTAWPTGLSIPLSPMLRSLVTEVLPPLSSISVAMCHVTFADSGFAANLRKISISLACNKVECSSCQWSEKTWYSSGLGSGISYELCENKKRRLHFDCIESFQCQNMDLSLPVKNLNIEIHEDASVDIRVNRAYFAVHNEGLVAWGQISSACKSMVFNIFPQKASRVSFHIQEMCFQNPNTSEVNIKIKQVEFQNFVSYEEGKLSIKSIQKLYIRIRLSTNDIIEGELKPFGFAITPSSLACDAIFANFETANGSICLSLPKLFVDRFSISCDGLISVKSSTLKAVKWLSSNLLYFTKICKNESSRSLPAKYLITIRSLKFILMDMETSVDVSFLTFNSLDKVSCMHVEIVRNMETVARFDRVEVCLSLLRMRIASIVSLCLPGICQLAKPATNVDCFISSEPLINVNIPNASIILLDNLSEARDIFTTLLPFPVRLSSSFLHMESFFGGKFYATEPNIFLSSSDFEYKFDLKAKSIAHDVLLIESAQLSGILDIKCENSVSEFCMHLGSVAIFADLRSIHLSKKLWKARQLHSRCPWELPFAKSGSFVLTVSFNGEIMSTDDSLRVPAFKGGRETTSIDVLDHCETAAFRHFPSFFEKTLVLGESASDVVAKACGRISGSTVTGSVLGSVGALVVTDGVKGLLDLRNAARDGKSKTCSLKEFGYGLHRTLVASAVHGGHLRRGDHVSYCYHVGDLSIGLLDRVSNYLYDNKSRFVAAGSAVVGMAFGGMAYGVVGSMLVNSLGARLAATLLRNPQSRNLPSEERQSDSNDMEKVVHVNETDDDWILINASVSTNNDTNTINSA